MSKINFIELHLAPIGPDPSCIQQTPTMSTAATATAVATTIRPKTTIMNTLMQIPCCLCGQMITPNAANQCSTCLAQQFDLKGLLQGSGSSKGGTGHELVIHQCRQCRKFARTDTVWEYAEPESPQLLQICLKHIPALNNNSHAINQYNLRVMDAIWVWTEPHSMRLKIRLTVRGEIENTPVQQRVLIEFIIKFHQCQACNREYTNRTWHAVVQLRQKRDDGSPRKGLAALDMALARNSDIRKHVLRIDSSRHGLDFYFLTLPNAQTFTSFLNRLAPMRIKTTQKLVSTDVKNNTANVKHTIACDMVPLCRHDLIVVVHNKKGSGGGGGTGGISKLTGRLCLVTKVSSVIHLMDASPKRTTTKHNNLDQYRAELVAESYYKAGGDKIYPILQTAERLVRFVVLDVELIGSDNNHGSNDSDQIYQGPQSGIEKYALADVQVARESDMGSNDTMFNCVTHLGHLLSPGDVVLGYDLVATANSLSISSSQGVVDLEDVLNSNFVLPDVILVKKVNENGNSAGEDNNKASSKKGGNNKNDASTSNGNEEDDNYEPVASGKKQRMSKKKQRRLKKQDKRRRELEETAARMGFLNEDGGGQYEDGEDEFGGLDGDGGSPKDFTKQLANDPELAADLQAVEQELATMKLNTEDSPDETRGDQTDNKDEDDSNNNNAKDQK